MKRNRVSVAMLAALAVCGAIQTASYAQGGVMLPESPVAPVVRVVPHVVEYSAKPARNDAAMPLPAPHPIAASGRIVHVQEINKSAVVSPIVVQPVIAAPAAMSMGGFTTIAPRPVSIAPTAGGR